MTQARKEALIDLRDKVTVGAWDSAEAAAIFALDQDEIEQAFGHALTSQMYRGYHAYAGSLDAAKALRISLGLPVPEKMHSDARIELLAILEALIEQEPDT